MKNTIIFLTLLVSLLLSNSIKGQVSLNNRIEFITDTAMDFNSLLNSFKGKIVYVDIWATWCAPCRQELRQKKEIKGFAEYALKNDIAVLYICGDFNGESWKQFISANNLIGSHIMVNKSIIETFHTTFSTLQKRQGKLKKSFYIPRHMIVDQSGAIVDSAADRQGSQSVYLTINKLLGRAAF